MWFSKWVWTTLEPNKHTRGCSNITATCVVCGHSHYKLRRSYGCPSSYCRNANLTQSLWSSYCYKSLDTGKTGYGNLTRLIVWGLKPINGRRLIIDNRNESVPYLSWSVSQVYFGTFRGTLHSQAEPPLPCMVLGSAVPARPRSTTCFFALVLICISMLHSGMVAM